MTFYFAMTNSWSLLYDEIYGEDTMTEDIRITSLESDEYDIITGTGNTASTSNTNYCVDTSDINNISINTTDQYPIREDIPSDLWGVPVPENIKVTTGNTGVVSVPQSAHTEDTIRISTSPTDTSFIYESPDGGNTVTRRPINSDPTDKEVICGDYFGNDYPMAQNFLADNDDAVGHHFTIGSAGDFTMSEGVESVTLNIPEEFQTPPPTPGIESDNPRKYKEDESIKALQDYISTTYGGHYTSDNNNVQTLDLIESVGDAESFCRSNAIKYLSRYDKKGQAKRDILKALHYSLLLYHFSGQLKETTNRGYETF